MEAGRGGLNVNAAPAVLPGPPDWPATLERSALALAFVGRDGAIRFANAAARAVFGPACAGAAFLPLLLPESVRPEARRLLEAGGALKCMTLARGLGPVFEARFVPDPEGAVVLVEEVTGRLVSDRMNSETLDQLDRSRELVRERYESQRLELREGERRFAGLFEAVDEPLAVIDRRLDILRLNRVARGLFEPLVRGRRTFSLLDFFPAETHAPLTAAAGGESVATLAAVAEFPGDRTLRFRMMFHPLVDGERIVRFLDATPTA